MNIFGHCVVCGLYLGESAYNCQGVISLIGPEGAVVCCVRHLFDGPNEKAPGYDAALKAMAIAKADQCKHLGERDEKYDRQFPMFLE